MKLQLLVIAGVCLGAALAKEVSFSGNIKCCVVESKRPIDDLPIGEGAKYEGDKGGQKGQQQQQQTQQQYGDIKETQVRRKRGQQQQWGDEYGTAKGGNGQQTQQQQQQQWKEVRTFADYDNVKGGQKKGQQTQQHQEQIPQVQVVVGNDRGVKGGQKKGQQTQQQQTQQQQEQQKGTHQQQQSGDWGEEYGNSGSNGKGQQTQQQQQQQVRQQQNRNKRNINEYCTAPLTWIVDLYDRFPLGIDEHLTTTTGTGGNFKVDYSGTRVFGVDPKVKITAHCDGYSHEETLEVVHGEHNINIIARPGL
uniref:Protein lethal(3)malignant blood neoplasm 1 n=1 Tax=Panagrellus redivivus TaxID=6233 RepID=A0A7E4UTJ8_PANRE